MPAEDQIQEGESMKKSISLAAAAILVCALFSGCGDGKDSAGAASEMRGTEVADGVDVYDLEEGTDDVDGADGTDAENKADREAERETNGSAISAEEGEQILREVFPEEGYEVYSDGKTYEKAACFEVEVGEACYEHLEDAAAKSGIDADEEAEVSDYTVGSREDEYGWANCYVSEDGRIIGFGTLVDKNDSNKVYRLR